MDSDERDICDFLKSWSGQFISGREIARRAGGKWRFRENKFWAVPVLARMVEKGLVQADASGHYRLIAEKKKGGPKKWVSPQIQNILEKSGKDFSDALDIAEDTEA